MWGEEWVTGWGLGGAVADEGSGIGGWTPEGGFKVPF